MRFNNLSVSNKPQTPVTITLTTEKSKLQNFKAHLILQEDVILFLKSVHR